MASSGFDPNHFSGLAHALVRIQQDEAAMRTAVSRLYYSAYLKALYHFFPDGNVPKSLRQELPRHRQGSHAVIIGKLLDLRWDLGSNMLALQQLRVQADYKLIPAQRFVSWTGNWELAAALEAEINRGYAEVGIQI